MRLRMLRKVCKHEPEVICTEVPRELEQIYKLFQRTRVKLMCKKCGEVFAEFTAVGIIGVKKYKLYDES